jgi:hypothetical protein
MLNILEMYACLMFRTLKITNLRSYLLKKSISTFAIGLNLANPLNQYKQTIQSSSHAGIKRTKAYWRNYAI